MQHRVQKIIAQAGICSRRKAETLIEQGAVQVNGKTITLGDQATANDIITVHGKPLPKTQSVTYILHKPKGYLCTCDDPKKRKTILELLPKHSHLYPVGRLDKDTTGLLIVTNNGDLAQQIAHPSNNVSKTYIATLTTPMQFKDIQRLRKPITLDDTKIKIDNIQSLATNKMQITIHVGKKHIVKHIFAYLGYTVKDLHRSAIGNLNLHNIKEGKHITINEQQLLTKIKG